MICLVDGALKFVIFLYFFFGCYKVISPYFDFSQFFREFSNYMRSEFDTKKKKYWFQKKGILKYADLGKNYMIERGKALFEL